METLILSILQQISAFIDIHFYYPNIRIGSIAEYSSPLSQMVGSRKPDINPVDWGVSPPATRIYPPEEQEEKERSRRVGHVT